MSEEKENRQEHRRSVKKKKDKLTSFSLFSFVFFSLMWIKGFQKVPVATSETKKVTHFWKITTSDCAQRKRRWAAAAALKRQNPFWRLKKHWIWKSNCQSQFQIFKGRRLYFNQRPRLFQNSQKLAKLVCIAILISTTRWCNCKNQV